MVTIRQFIKSDWPEVSEIYKQGLKTKMATFETSIPTWDEWDKKFIPSCRLVAHINDTILGFAALSLVSSRKVYRGVAEVTLYVAEEFRGQGIGKKLLNALIEESEANGFWTLHAGIFSENIASIELHKKCGFRVVGIKEKIGQLDGEWHDNHFLERRSKRVGN